MATPPLGREGATDASEYQYELNLYKVNVNENQSDLAKDSLAPEKKNVRGGSRRGDGPPAVTGHRQVAPRAP